MTANGNKTTNVWSSFASQFAKQSHAHCTLQSSTADLLPPNQVLPVGGLHSALPFTVTRRGSLFSAVHKTNGHIAKDGFSRKIDDFSFANEFTTRLRLASILPGSILYSLIPSKHPGRAGFLPQFDILFHWAPRCLYRY